VRAICVVFFRKGVIKMNEKLRGFAKKVFNKKTLMAAIVVIVIIVALRIAFFVLFEVEGVVSKIDGSQITVTNFLGTRTVDIGTFQTVLSSIQVGDRVEIMKNLSGDVISVRDGSRGHMDGSGYLKGNDKPGLKGDGGRGSIRR
jgi:hypothetical protein